MVELAYLFDPTEFTGNHTHCVNENGPPPRRQFNQAPENPSHESMDEDTPENTGFSQEKRPDSYWEHLTFDLGGTNRATPSPSPSPSPSSSNATNMKRKGPATSNMESLVGIIEGGFGYFQSDADAQREKRIADRLERQAEKVVDEKDRAERRAADEKDRVERKEKKELRDKARAEGEASSVSEVVMELMEMKELDLVDIPFIKKVSPRLCKDVEYRKAFLAFDNLESKLFFLTMMRGRDSDSG